MPGKQTFTQLAPSALVVLLSVAAMPSEAARGRRVAVDQLPGNWANEATLDLTGDRYSTALPLPGDMSVRIGDGVYRYVWVNENGFISLTSTAANAPAPFSGAQSWNDLAGAVIAPFHADIRTRTPESDCFSFGATGSLCDVTYSTLDLRGQVPDPGEPAFDHILAMRVNWGYFGNDNVDPALDPGVVPNQGASTDETRRSTFQLKLIDRSQATGVAGDFDLQFNYNAIAWESADALVGLQAGDVRLDFADFYDSFLGTNPDSSAAALAACGATSSADPYFNPSNPPIDLPCNRITIEFRNGVPNLKTYTADITTTLTAPTGSTHAAEVFPLTLRVLNESDDVATNVSAAIALPSDTTLISTSPASADCTQTGATATCRLGSVTAGTSADVTLNLRSMQIGPRSYSVAVDADQYDFDLATNAVDVQVNLGSSADVSISTCTSPSVVQGSTATLTCTVTNAGPQAATAVVLEADLPANISFASGSGCSANGARVTCSIATLAAGATTDFSVVLNAVSSGTANVSTSVSAAEFDPVSTNSFTASLVVSAPAAPAPRGGGGGALSPLLFVLLLLRRLKTSAVC